jgi:hypothetical protein
VYSKNRATVLFKICDAKSKITRKKSGLFLFLWYPVVLEGGIDMDTIRELFYGNIHPYERENPKRQRGRRYPHHLRPA